MSSALTALALQIGVPIVGRILTRRLGAQNAQLATDVIGAVASRLGVSADEAEALAESDPPRVVDALRQVETMAPEMVALHAAALEGQYALLMAEQRGPWWGWAWRPAFMWLLAGLWLWTVVLLHIANAIWRIALPPIDPGVLLSVTGIYAALYMGGHTVKDWVRISRQGTSGGAS
ncbi:hypothetical protein [Pararhodobacter zhoushanensis]|uniref:Holin of 3TMs, for gene-transfer release n=1 Tax=Pararhodobacter zhoushanensis TaxID=2479545 RepID=A0ABT3H2Y5_9RHOB|nr:hypothetical protein [Pararhodobacter zhoushanensis]MCW1934105.1 hypothetical protein [Pararhodobacter zhoushanensis]